MQIDYGELENVFLPVLRVFPPDSVPANAITDSSGDPMTSSSGDYIVDGT